MELVPAALPLRLGTRAGSPVSNLGGSRVGFPIVDCYLQSAEVLLN